MHCLRYSLLYFKLIICLSIVSQVISKDIDFTGYGATGYVFYDRQILNDYIQESYYRGKLQVEIELSKQIDAQLDLRGNSVDKSVRFREFSVKFKYNPKLRFKVGNIKRPFGYEQLTSVENLYTVERSLVQQYVSLKGYGGRSVSVMAYYNYSEKRPEFPYSYSISLFKDNSNSSGAALRGSFHSGKISYGCSYLFQSTGVNQRVSAHGFSADLQVQRENFRTGLELFLVQDPLPEQQILAQNQVNSQAQAALNPDYEKVFGTGASLLTARTFNTNAEVIKKIEPLILLSLYLPDIDIPDTHVIQTLIGLNLYFTKNVRLRINGDLHLTKNEYNEAGDYATDESRVILDLQVRF
jgi:hypothetical protein